MSTAINNFKLFITYLNENGVHYVILGRTASLQEIIEGDIDIAISEKDFKNINLLIGGFCSENNISFIQNIQHESTSKYIILSDNLDHSIICPDVCSHYLRDKRLLIHNSDLLQNRRLLSVEGLNISILNAEYEFLYYLLKKIDKSELNHLAFAHLCEQFELASKKVIINILSSYFYKDTVLNIIEIFDKKDFDTLLNLIPNYRRELHKKTPVKLKYFVKDIILKVKRILTNTGLSITIMGCDGSGKSTVINSILKNLSHAFRATDYYHLKPIKTKSNMVVSNPQDQKPYPFFKSIVKLIFLVYQYNMGFFKVRLQLIKSTLVVFDRYFEDLLVDNLRFRYGAPNFFAKIALIFIPKPKLYIFLDASGEIIYKRKQELSVEEINRQRQKYLHLFNNRKRYFIVDASQKEKLVVQDIEKIILNHLKTRQKKSK